MSPVQLLGTILTDIKTLPKGYGRTSFMEGRRAMEKLTEELVGLAERKLGRRRAKKLRRDISFFRNFAGTREYPKYFWVCRYDIYKQALQRTAEDLALRGSCGSPATFTISIWKSCNRFCALARRTGRRLSDSGGNTEGLPD